MMLYIGSCEDIAIDFGIRIDWKAKWNRQLSLQYRQTKYVKLLEEANMN